MEKILILKKADKELGKLTSFTYSAKRMAGAPTITSTYYSFVENEIDSSCYTEFNGERYYIKQTPTSSKSYDDARYEYELEFISERNTLDNIYFYDVDLTNNSSVAKQTKFSFNGTVRELAEKIQKSIDSSYGEANYYRIIIDEGIDPTNTLQKLISFDDTTVNGAIQEFFKSFNMPYYYKYEKIDDEHFRAFHVGYESESVVGVNKEFEYGANNELIEITRSNANYKAINSITGYGATKNLPLYYPNETATGEHTVTADSDLQYQSVSLDKLNSYTNIHEGAVLTYHVKPEIPQGIKSYKISYGAYNTTVGSTSNLHLAVGTNLTNALMKFYGEGGNNETPDYMVSTISIKLYAYANEKITLQFSTSKWWDGGLEKHKAYDEVVINKIWPTAGGDDVAFKMTGMTLEFTARQKGEHTIKATLKIKKSNFPTNIDLTTWVYGIGTDIAIDPVRKIPKEDYVTIEGKEDEWIYVSEISLKVGKPTDNAKITISSTKQFLDVQKNLMPPIFRNTLGLERFYKASNTSVTAGKSPNTYTYDFGDHIFNNPFETGRQVEHILNEEDIYPTIKGVTHNGLPIDVIAAVDFDEGNSDETEAKDDGGSLNYKFPRFYIKLNPLGFNLFDHASEQGEMTISMTSGRCMACNFKIQVTENGKNPIRVDSNGNIEKKDGKAVTNGTPQDAQNDTTNNSVWIAVLKDTEAFGHIMPSVKEGASVAAGDSFILLNINLPHSFVLDAERRLEEKIFEYLKGNNDEKFNFSINFSRIYLANNESIRKALNENARIWIKYFNTKTLLYVSGYSYRMEEGEALPEITVDLADTLSTQQGAMQNIVDSVKFEVMNSLEAVDVVAQAARAFVRKDQDDRTLHNITVNNFMATGDSNFIGNTYIDGNQSIEGSLEVEGDAAIQGNAQIKGNTLFGDYSDVLGEVKGGRITNTGDATFASIRSNYLEVFTLTYNKIRATSAYTSFDDTGTILEITPTQVDGNAVYTIVFEEDKSYESHLFQDGDILFGYVNNIQNGGYSQYGRCWLNVTQADVDGNPWALKAVMFNSDQCPDNENVSPTTNMVVMHKGNNHVNEAGEYDKPERQRSFYISSKDGYIVQLLEVTSPKLYTLMNSDNPHNYSNYGVVMGRLPDDLFQYIHEAFPYVQPEDPVLYAKYVAVQNLLQIDYAGRPIKSNRFRGEWSLDVANSDDPYRSDRAADVTYYDTVTHGGSLWRCASDKTTEEPSDSSTAWLTMAKKGDDGLTPQANLLKNTNFDLFTTATDFAETSDLSEIISDYYGEKWVRFTRQSNRNHAAIAKILNGVYEPRYEPFDVNQDNCYWCFVGTPESFKIYNKFVGSSLALTATSISSSAKCSFVDYASAINWTMSLTLNSDGSRPILTKDNTTLGINSFQGLQNGGELHLYQVRGDAGSQWFLGSKENRQLMYWEEQNGEITDFRGSNAYHRLFDSDTPNTLLSCTLPRLNSGSYSLSFFLMSSSTDTDVTIERANGSALPISIVSSMGTISNGNNYTKATIHACNDFTPIEINLNVTEGIGDDVILRFSNRLKQGDISLSKIKFEESVKATPYQLADSDMCAPVKSTVFKRVSSKPNKPDGGSYSQPVPSGWSDGIPAASNNINAIYSSTRTFYSGGYSTKWTEPQLLADSSVFDVCYCLKDTYTMEPPATHPDGYNDDWQNSPSENAVWMATSTYTAGGTWSAWTITKIKGEDGESPYVADLTNEMDSIALNSDGTAASADADGRKIETTVSLFHGHEKQALSLSDVAVETPDAWGDNIVEKTLSNGNKDCNIAITVPAGIVIDARTEILITITKGTIVRELVLTINGVKGGENGEPAVLYQLIPSHNQIVKKKDGSTVPTAITFRAYKIEGAQRANVTDENICTVKYSGGASGRDNVNKVSISTSGVATSIKAELIVNNSTVDSETIAVVFDGNDGNDGENGVTPEWNLLDNSAFQIDEEGDCEFWTLSSDAELVEDGIVNSIELDYDLYYAGSGYTVMAKQFLVGKLKPLKWYVFSVEVSKSVTSGSLTVSFGRVGPISDVIYVNGSKTSSTYDGSVSLASGHNEIVFETTEGFGGYGDECLTFTVQSRPDSKYCIRKPKIELASDQVNPYLSKSTGWNYSVNDMSGTDGSSPQENLVLNSNFDMYESSEFESASVTSSVFTSIMSQTYGECWVRLKRYSKPEHYLYINSTENDAIPYYGPNPISIEASLWCFVGTTSSFKIYNKYAGPTKSFRIERDGPDYPWWFAEVCDAADAGNWKFGSTDNYAIAICGAGGGDTYINAFAAHENGGLSALYSLDDGSRWKVEKLGYRGLKFWEREDGYVVENSYDGFNSYALTATTGNTGISQITPNLELNTWYTLSCRFRSFNTSTAFLDVVLDHAFAADDVVTSSEDSPIFGGQTTVFGFEALNSVWKTASVSFKLTSSPTRFYYTFCCTTDGGAIYITHPKLERGKKATPYRKAETDLAGPAGETGPMLVPQGTWDAGITYKSNSAMKPFVYHEGHYYVLEAAYSKGQEPDNNGSIWNVMDEIEYLFTKFLMANQARFGSNNGGVFYDNLLFSAKMKNGGYYGSGSVDPNEEDESKVPMLAIDFREGKLYAEEATIRGHIEATSGEFKGKLNATSGTIDKISATNLTVSSGKIGDLKISDGTINGELYDSTSSGVYAHGVYITKDIVRLRYNKRVDGPDNKETYWQIQLGTTPQTANQADGLLLERVYSGTAVDAVYKPQIRLKSTVTSAGGNGISILADGSILSKGAVVSLGTQGGFFSSYERLSLDKGCILFIPYNAQYDCYLPKIGELNKYFGSKTYSVEFKLVVCPYMLNSGTKNIYLRGDAESDLGLTYDYVCDDTGTGIMNRSGYARRLERGNVYSIHVCSSYYGGGSNIGYTGQVVYTHVCKIG